MVQVKEINIKSGTYCFFNDKIHLNEIDSSLLKIDKKSYKDIDIYCIGYITIKKFTGYENIYSANLSYSIIHSSTGHFKDLNDNKYLILNSGDKYDMFGLKLDQKSKQSVMEKKSFIKKNYGRIGINNDDDLSLNKPLKFPTLKIIVQYVFQEGEKLHP